MVEKSEKNNKNDKKFFVHASAEVDAKAKIGEGTKIWHQAQVRAATLGKNCVIGKDVYVAEGVRVGDNVKIQNTVSVYAGVVIEDGVFVGPQAVFTNDFYPRAVNPDGTLKAASDWHVGKTLVKRGASIGAGAIIVCGRTGGEPRVIGDWAMIAAGAVVTRDVPAHALAAGNPARVVGFVCKCGEKLEKQREDDANAVLMKCKACGETVKIPSKDYALLNKK